MLWAGLGCWGLLYLTSEMGLFERASITIGGVAGLLYGYYWYEELDCTCDDPDHEH